MQFFGQVMTLFNIPKTGKPLDSAIFSSKEFDMYVYRTTLEPRHCLPSQWMTIVSERTPLTKVPMLFALDGFDDMYQIGAMLVRRCSMIEMRSEPFPWWGHWVTDCSSRKWKNYWMAHECDFNIMSWLASTTPAVLNDVHSSVCYHGTQVPMEAARNVFEAAGYRFDMRKRTQLSLQFGTERELRFQPRNECGSLVAKWPQFCIFPFKTVKDGNGELTLVTEEDWNRFHDRSSDGLTTGQRNSRASRVDDLASKASLARSQNVPATGEIAPGSRGFTLYS